MLKTTALILGLFLSGCASVGPKTAGVFGPFGAPSPLSNGSSAGPKTQAQTTSAASSEFSRPLSALSAETNSASAPASTSRVAPLVETTPQLEADRSREARDSDQPAQTTVALAKPAPSETPKSRPFSFFSGATGGGFFTPRHENLVDRITAGFGLPELDSPLVETHERWIVRNPEYLKRVFERGGKYLHHIVEELESRKLPTESALLPIVESAFNPQALSSAKAAGLWRFIPSTGRIYDLKQDWWLDQRRDVIESTRAALDYLQKLYEFQDNDWFLALASYNWGEGAVKRARKKNEAQGKDTDYLSLKMPRETRNYVPKLIALRNVLANPQRFGIEVPFIENKPYFVVIDKEQSIDLKLAARFAGMTTAEFTALNPSHHRPVISASRTNRIVLPAERADLFQERLLAYMQSGAPLVSWKPYTLKPGESLSALASRSGVSANDLIAANSLRRGANPLPGTVLLAPVAVQVDESHIENTLARLKGTKVVEQERVPPLYHKVRKNETLASVARKHGVTQDRLRNLNNLQGEVKTGMRLVVRPSFTRTVMTDERGVKQVVKAPPNKASTPSTSSNSSVASASNAKPSNAKPSVASSTAATSAAPQPQAPEPKRVASAAGSPAKVKPQ